MKRLTLLAAGALSASFCFISPASAQPVENAPTSVSAVVTASDSPPEAVSAVVAAPTPQKYTVVSGDTLWAIGIRFLRSESAWSSIASYNRIPNPNLIYVGDVITIPPATYTGSVPLPTPAPSYSPPPPVTHTTAPARTYTPPARTVQSAPSGSFQACVAMRESGNGSGSSNIYGFLQSTWNSLGLGGSPGSASRAQQDAAFAELYARDGTAPWAPYDGC